MMAFTNSKDAGLIYICSAKKVRIVGVLELIRKPNKRDNAHTIIKIFDIPKGSNIMVFIVHAYFVG